jgi:glycine betaine/proline transport system permease protein
MEGWITGYKLPLGWAVKQFIAWLQAHASWFFDLITDGIGFMVDGLTAILLHIPAGLVILAVAALAWRL